MQFGWCNCEVLFSCNIGCKYIVVKFTHMSTQPSPKVSISKKSKVQLGAPKGVGPREGLGVGAMVGFLVGVLEGTSVG